MMPQIAIVGAGIAGLNAALTLQDAGLSCSLYEASNRVGGRMHSHTTSWSDGVGTEWCGEFIDNEHETIQRPINRFRPKPSALRNAQPDRHKMRVVSSIRHTVGEDLA